MNNINRKKFVEYLEKEYDKYINDSRIENYDDIMHVYDQARKFGRAEMLLDIMDKLITGDKI